MGIIGDELLERIKGAEDQSDWELTLSLLVMAQLEATKNLTKKKVMFAINVILPHKEDKGGS